MNWELFLYKLGREFFSLPAMQLSCLITMIVYLINPVKSSSTKYLAIVAFASFVQILIVEFIMLYDLNKKTGTYIDQKVMYIYLVVEITCCGLYVRENIQSGKSKKLMLASLILFSIYTITFGITHLSIKYLPSHIAIIEGLLIIVYCLYFFYELFIIKSDKILLSESSFWAISGMLVLFSTITPLFLFFNYIVNNHYTLAHSLYAINNIAYCLLFVTFIIAILQNKRTAESNPTKIFS